MAMLKRRTMEITLTRVCLPGIHAADKTGPRLLSAFLVWPRPAIARKAVVKKIELKDGAADFSGSGWTDRILFKETVEGPFGLELAVSDRLSDKIADEFLSMLGAALWRLVGVEAGDMAGSPLSGGLIETPFKCLAKLAGSESGEDPRILASGTMDLCADGKMKPLDTLRKDIELIAPADAFRMERIRRGNGFTSRRRTTVKRGGHCGAVEIAVRTYD